MLCIHPSTETWRGRKRKNLNFPKVYVQGRLTFCQPSFVLLACGTCRFKPFWKIVGYLFLYIPKDNISIICPCFSSSFPQLYHRRSWPSFKRKRKQFQNREPPTQDPVNLMVPGSQGPECLSVFQVAMATMTPVITGHFNIYIDDSLRTPVSLAIVSIPQWSCSIPSHSSYDSHGQKYPRTCHFGGNTVWISTWPLDSLIFILYSSCLSQEVNSNNFAAL